MTTVKQIYDMMDRIAPFKLTEKGDNTGLLVGEGFRSVNRVLLSLDITNKAVDEAVTIGAELIISHHPVIYNPIYSLSNDNPVCFMLKNNISAICAHTNLDMAREGVNDVLCKVLGFSDIKKETVETVYKMPYKQVGVFIPETHVEQVYRAMCEAGGGEQGEYSDCAFTCNGKGRFLPKQNAKPFIGEIGKAEDVNEVRLEMLVKPFRLDKVISAMKFSHPYEEPSYQILDNSAIFDEYGFGKLCSLEKEVSPKELAGHVKTALGCKVIRYVDGGKPIKTVAVCSGGGGGLLKEVIGMGADAYICGDIKHDQFISAVNAGFSLFDAGHFHTESVILPYLKNVLSKEFPDVSFEVAQSNTDPVSYEL